MRGREKRVGLDIVVGMPKVIGHEPDDREEGEEWGVIMACEQHSLWTHSVGPDAGAFGTIRHAQGERGVSENIHRRACVENIEGYLSGPH